MPQVCSSNLRSLLFRLVSEISRKRLGVKSASLFLLRDMCLTPDQQVIGTDNQQAELIVQCIQNSSKWGQNPPISAQLPVLRMQACSTRLQEPRSCPLFLTTTDQSWSFDNSPLRLRLDSGQAHAHDMPASKNNSDCPPGPFTAEEIPRAQELRLLITTWMRLFAGIAELTH